MYATALRYVPFALRGTSVHPRALKLHGGRSSFCEESRREARRRPKRPCARLQKASSRPISHSARFLRVRNARARSVGSTHPLPRPARSAPRGSAHPRAAPPSPSAGRGGAGGWGLQGGAPSGQPRPEGRCCCRRGATPQAILSPSVRDLPCEDGIYTFSQWVVTTYLQHKRNYCDA